MRALVVAYAFPPVGGAGVQRVQKLVKYLPLHGVTPSVLTVANPSVPLRDDSLESDLPKDIEIVRAPTLEPGYRLKLWALRKKQQEGGKAGRSDPRLPVHPEGLIGNERVPSVVGGAVRVAVAARIKAGLVRLGRNLLVPDPQVLWLPGAHRALLGRLISARPDDLVFISGPPFSQFCLAALARMRAGTAVVLDYRDEWTVAPNVYAEGGRRPGVVDEGLERAVLRCAHAVTTATEAFRCELLARFPFLDPMRVHTICNGYDPEDFPPSQAAPPSDRFVMTYVGTIFSLTSARGLIDAVRILHARAPELAKHLELRFVGRIVESETAYFEGTETIGVRRLGYLPHHRAIEELSRSHAAICILDEVEGAERVYPAKIFELMYLRRPCLVLAPEGALAELVRRCHAAEIVSPRDAAAIADALARRVQEFRDGRAPRKSEAIDIERFDRRLLAGEFADVFRQARRAARKRSRVRGRGRDRSRGVALASGNN